MYLHLGKDISVEKDSVIGVFDLDNTSQSIITRDFLARSEKAGRVVNVSDDLPKSFVVCESPDRTGVYLSQLNTATLLKRSKRADL